MADSTLRRTPLHDLHKSLGAKMEKEVNEWLATLGPGIEIKHVDNVSDRVSNNTTGGEDRRIMLMVWTGPK